MRQYYDQRALIEGARKDDRAGALAVCAATPICATRQPADPLGGMRES